MKNIKVELTFEITKDYSKKKRKNIIKAIICRLDDDISVFDFESENKYLYLPLRGIKVL